MALDVRTGEVLGLGSYPAENPEEFRGDSGKFREMLADTATPLLNRAVQGRYPPGSSFKLVTAAAGLAEGVVGPETRYTCNGRTRVAGRTFRCHRTQGHGSLTLREAISKSCNVFFYRLSEALDVDVIASYARAFGLGERTGVDLRNESSGLIPTREWKRRAMGERWYASETASVSVGQGAVSVTPIQMARLAAAVASGGNIPTPRLVGIEAGGQVGGRHARTLRGDPQRNAGCGGVGDGVAGPDAQRGGRRKDRNGPRWRARTSWPPTTRTGRTSCALTRGSWVSRRSTIRKSRLPWWSSTGGPVGPPQHRSEGRF